jgi:hypothetical protein
MQGPCFSHCIRVAVQGPCFSHCIRVAVQGLGKTITGLALICKTRGTIPTPPLDPDGNPFKCTWVKDPTGRPAAFYTGALISSVAFCLVLAQASRKRKKKKKTMPFGLNFMRSQVLYRAAHTPTSTWSKSHRANVVRLSVQYHILCCT